MSLPKPYYQDDAVTLYHGDCREIVPLLGRFDLLLTDPPYGVSGELNSKTAGSQKKNDYIGFKDSVVYVRQVVVPAIVLCFTVCDRAIITPGNRCFTLYPEPDSFGVFYQPASVGLQPWGRADAQPILYYGKCPHDSKTIPGRSLSFQLTEAPEKNGHPCPKPISTWSKLLLAGTTDLQTVLDPFAGSGTTGRACKDLGRKCVMIEREEKYCEIAAKRMRQEVLPI